MENLRTIFRKKYNDNVDMKRVWGGGEVGIKSQHKRDKKTHAVEAELATKAQA